MDINSLSMQYLNQAYVPLSSSAALVPGLSQGGESDFSEILRRTQNNNSSTGSGASSSPVLRGQIDKTDKLYELCSELETFLIKNLIKGMRSTVQKTNLIDTGFAGEVYEDMLYDEYAKTYSKNANFGFAEMAYRELTQTAKIPG